MSEITDDEARKFVHMLSEKPKARVTKPFTPKEYRTLVNALDMALIAFQETTVDDAAAEAALKDFILEHYFKVWRGMSRP